MTVKILQDSRGATRSSLAAWAACAACAWALMLAAVHIYWGAGRTRSQALWRGLEGEQGA